MATDQVMSLYGPQPAYAPIGQPKIAFDQSLQLHLNGISIDLIYPGPAHTDGDTLVFFRERNVLMTGDVFVRPPYTPPYFDDLQQVRQSLEAGHLPSWVTDVDQVLGLADQTGTGRVGVMPVRMVMPGTRIPMW